MNPRIENAISDPNTVFFLFPTPRIQQLIMDNVHPYVVAMPQSVKTSLLEGKAYPVANQMVLDFLKGNLDEKNHFLLSQCELRVMQPKGGLVNDLSIAPKT
jgi:hypothetical protein